eukprot:TRINITY_DN101_c0_g1_i2.p2 TRINITY_DN101_c0_g1~~TRINITY_DN101_c0_g1_i2.p2  ORF type:complete len:322 (+),score=153.94 TRINITY_DN101_c0_g1_i2:87-968(+)
MRAAAALALGLLCHGAAGDEQASSVCVYNSAAFVLHWHLEDENTGARTDETGSYPVGQVKCLSADALTGSVTAGHVLTPHVHAVLGKDWSAGDGNKVTYNQSAVGSVTYTCKGTILSYSCSQGPPPPTAANVTKAIGLFLLGFVDALGEDIGFGKCIADIKSTFNDIGQVASFFENGVSKKSADPIGKGFLLLGKLLIDFGKAILDCVAEGTALAGKFSALGAKIQADPFSVIEVIVKELIYVLAHKDDITTDCKSLPVDWHAGDWQSSGHDVGDIVGILIAGLEQDQLQIKQ